MMIIIIRGIARNLTNLDVFQLMQLKKITSSNLMKTLHCCLNPAASIEHVVWRRLSKNLSDIKSLQLLKVYLALNRANNMERGIYRKGVFFLNGDMVSAVVQQNYKSRHLVSEDSRSLSNMMILKQG